MLIAAIVAGFTGCKKDDNESTEHSQTFTLGETTYDIDNAITIENIQYQSSDVYNAIVLSKQLIGENSGEGQGVVIVFKGNITSGTHNLSANNESFPKYLFGNIEIADIVNFNINNLLAQDDFYVATSGSFTLEISNGTYTITTEGIEMENTVNPNNIETSSVDYEGTPSRYILATVEEGNINETNIVTAGYFDRTILSIKLNIVCFISEAGDMLGFTSMTSFTDGVPTGDFTNSDYPIIFAEKMNIEQLNYASSGNIHITKDGDVYTIDMTTTINSSDYTLHYVGTLPYFDFPF